MRRIRHHGGQVLDLAASYPGTDAAARSRLEGELQRLLIEGQRAGTPFAARVVHMEVDRVRLRSRLDVATELREGGVVGLARQIERAVVPLGYFLAFVDVEGATDVTVTSIAGALAGDAQ